MNKRDKEYFEWVHTQYNLADTLARNLRRRKRRFHKETLQASEKLSDDLGSLWMREVVHQLCEENQ